MFYINQFLTRSFPIRLVKTESGFIVAFVRILLIANLSLNQALLAFLLCGRQTWMTQLILTISL